MLELPLLKLADHLENKMKNIPKLPLFTRGHCLAKFKLYYEPLEGDKELQKWLKKTH